VGKFTFRLASVLRARKAQEDAARAEVLRARTEAERLAARTRLYEDALGVRRAPDNSSPESFAATLMARQAMAASLNAAIAVAQSAEEVVTDRTNDLTTAAMRRRTVERLSERHAEEARRAEETVVQREVDDIATTAAQRRPPAAADPSDRPPPDSRETDV
jgi:flagellar export protein FliJ